jgi:hypothetical protein
VVKDVVDDVVVGKNVVVVVVEMVDDGTIDETVAVGTDKLVDNSPTSIDCTPLEVEKYIAFQP